MPNREAVYMHDTPSKQLFAANYRFLSHGCVRVDDIYALAVWLLNANPNNHWDRGTIIEAVGKGDRKRVRTRQADSGRMDRCRRLGERRRHGSLSAGRLQPGQPRGKSSNAAIRRCACELVIVLDAIKLSQETGSFSLDKYDRTEAYSVLQTVQRNLLRQF